MTDRHDPPDERETPTGETTGPEEPSPPDAAPTCIASPNYAYPLLAPGRYLGEFSHWETRVYRGFGGKLLVFFAIHDGGGPDRLLLTAFYRCTKLIGPPGPSGSFEVSENSSWARDRALITGAHNRRDLSPAGLIGIPLIVTAGLVRFDSRGQSIHEDLQYARVTRIERAVSQRLTVGGDRSE